MNKIKSFVKTMILGGVVVILPIMIVVAIFSWLYNKVTDIIQPLTTLVSAKSSIQGSIADIVVILLIVGFCFILGMIVKTSVGRYIHNNLESKLLSFAPGYKLVKETVLQFLGRTKAPFSSVVLVQLYENSTLSTAFVTDEHEDGNFTVFVPTGPNPTSGLIYHLKKQFVHPLDIGVEEAMRTIISCGAGSSKFVNMHKT